MFWTAGACANRGEPDGSSALSCSSASSRRLPRSRSARRSIELLYGIWRPQDVGCPPVRTVRQQESPGDVGHHGVSPGVRISAGASAPQGEPAAFHTAYRECAQATRHDTNLARGRRVPDDARGAAVGLSIRPHRIDVRLRAQHGADTPARALSPCGAGSFFNSRCLRPSCSRSPTTTLLLAAVRRIDHARAGRTRPSGDLERHDSARADFPVTGTGAGTFGKAINVYQTAEPGYAIDQAHNHYLQLMAEGGAWLLLPGVLAVGFFRRRCEPQPQAGSVIGLSHPSGRVRGNRRGSGAEHLGNRVDDARERAAVRGAGRHRDVRRRSTRAACGSTGRVPTRRDD